MTVSPSRRLLMSACLPFSHMPGLYAVRTSVALLLELLFSGRTLLQASRASFHAPVFRWTAARFRLALFLTSRACTQGRMYSIE